MGGGLVFVAVVVAVFGLDVVAVFVELVNLLFAFNFL
jgi:hypothetical protein